MKLKTLREIIKKKVWKQAQEVSLFPLENRSKNVDLSPVNLLPTTKKILMPVI